MVVVVKTDYAPELTCPILGSAFHAADVRHRHQKHFHWGNHRCLAESGQPDQSMSAAAAAAAAAFVQPFSAAFSLFFHFFHSFFSVCYTVCTTVYDSVRRWWWCVSVPVTGELLRRVQSVCPNASFFCLLSPLLFHLFFLFNLKFTGWF